MKSRLILVVVAFCSLAGGCAGDKFVGRPDLTTLVQKDLPPPDRADLIVQRRSYVVGPFDRVSIDVYGVPEISRTVNVDASGVISLPLVGIVPAAGKTATELAAAIADRLRGRYVRNPEVTVNTETVNQTITVEGEVEQPGLYPVTGRMTLIRAVATARGLSEYANSNHIVVFRQVNGKQMAALYDLRAIRQGMYEDPEVFANDVVSVGESGNARIFQRVVASSALLAAPLVAILN
jgi:polysaccharide export outer membrane protein